MYIQQGYSGIGKVKRQQDPCDRALLCVSEGYWSQKPFRIHHMSLATTKLPTAQSHSRLQGFEATSVLWGCSPGSGLYPLCGCLVLQLQRMCGADGAELASLLTVLQLQRTCGTAAAELVLVLQEGSRLGAKIQVNTQNLTCKVFLLFSAT